MLMSNFVTGHTSQGLESRALAPTAPAIVLMAPKPLVSTATASSSVRPYCDCFLCWPLPRQARPGGSGSDLGSAACLAVVQLSVGLCPSFLISALASCLGSALGNPPETLPLDFAAFSAQFFVPKDEIPRRCSRCQTCSFLGWGL